jgi:hypothetical protein
LFVRSAGHRPQFLHHRILQRVLSSGRTALTRSNQFVWTCCTYLCRDFDNLRRHLRPVFASTEKFAPS